MVLSDVDIRRYIEKKELIIDPLSEDTVRENGVDLRLDGEFLRLAGSGVYDSHSKDLPKATEHGESFVINPGERFLVLIREKIKLPANLVGFINLRSTYARLGLLIPPTIVDAGFEGKLTIGVSGSSVPVKLYAGDRFIHLILAKTESPSGKPYDGRYSNKNNIAPAVWI